MSFKNFYKQREEGKVELYEAYEEFYLAEALENESTVEMTDEGGRKILGSFKGTTFDKNDTYTYYEKLEDVPSEYKKDRELVITFSTQGQGFKKTESGDIQLPGQFVAKLLMVTNDSKIKDIFDESKLFSKVNIKRILKKLGKEFDVDEKLYNKTIIDYIDGLKESPYTAATYRDFKDLVNIRDVSIDGDRKFNAYKVEFIKDVEKFSKEEKGTNKNVHIVSDSQAEYIFFGSETNTRNAQVAYKSYAEGGNEKTTKELELARFYLTTEDGTLLDVVYNLKQSESLPEKLLKVIDVEKKEKRSIIREYYKEHENAQVLGVYLPNAKAIYNKVVELNVAEDAPYENAKFQKVVAPLFAAIKKVNAEQDVKVYMDKLEERLKKGKLKDFLAVLSYAAGVSEFFKDVVKYSEPHVIFAQIGKFIKAESNKMKYKEMEDYGKVSTVDFVISNVDGDELVKLIEKKNTNLVAHSDGSINVVDDEDVVLANYFQVSLKENKKESSLGRNMELVKKKFGTHIKGADKLHESIDLLNEGILDKLSELGKKGFEKLKALGANFIEKIKIISTHLKEFFAKALVNFTKLSDENLSKAVEELYGDLALNEALRNIQVKKYADNLFKKENAEEIYKNAEIKLLQLAYKHSKGKNVSIEIIPTKVEKLEPKHFINQIFHFTFLNTFEELFIRGGEGTKEAMQKVTEEIVDLYAESIFGATKLPLWKVFKYTGEEKVSYQLIGSKDEYKTNKKEKLKGVTNDVILLKLVGKTSDRFWNIMCLVDIMNEKGEQVYSRYEIGYTDNMSSSAKFKEDLSD